MLTNTYLSTIAMTNKDNNKININFLQKFKTVLITLFIIDLIILILFIRALAKCYESQKISGLLLVLLFIGFFIPGIGFFVALGTIVYGEVACKSSLPSQFRYRLKY